MPHLPEAKTYRAGTSAVALKKKQQIPAVRCTLARELKTDYIAA